ncbi:hypothetical protein PoB_006904600 [Plakobranchus ocellatus]|uniref:Uncharacterized protein n=1 Tax=Plakobranchus ocellatus TaxID=259542 RepID=A0AAV4DFE4_9GAST|nr:hypothetical protein PoB_006904600 [Plakobranchus ocellatus]
MCELESLLSHTHPRHCSHSGGQCGVPSLSLSLQATPLHLPPDLTKTLAKGQTPSGVARQLVLIIYASRIDLHTQSVAFCRPRPGTHLPVLVSGIFGTSLVQPTTPAHSAKVEV